MKLVSYRCKKSYGAFRIGIVDGDKVMDVNEAFRQYLLANGEKDHANTVDSLLPSAPNSYYALGEQAFKRSQIAYDFVKDHSIENVSFNRNEVVLSQPIPTTAKVICVGKNYSEHVKEMKSEIPTFPVLFAKFPNAMIGPEDPILKSVHTNELDYEAELAVVIGKTASHVHQQDALDYVVGYTIGNDSSARDLQKRTPQWLQGKSLDHSSPIGPWVVTTDELPDPSNLDIKSFVNGEPRQSSNTKHLIFDVPFLIEFISGLITLNPGDVILSGTPDGVGFAMDPPQFLNAGDSVRIEIEKIGQLENKVK
ncbi:fumarylacetoacetate hydrolase family protein [Aquibacillus sp. 3ASR75-11]|uniref:Fumarylacetoacetate hydrolase family protein n=1 Tax=Terrihalobacillus insolitus TaxID=2950438 RepID=A0A9X3WRJ9_9BACI|nr:fumarylacetoacetate hydrolase family protein [Terrihalobacillus insolitus]MDC3424460.1 fumarylacetoacetate hydrolase family protein [Terrihalobacillus insolitus]